MTKKQEFIKFVEMAIEAYPTQMNEDARVYWESFKGAKEEEKPLFTDNGKMILKYMQEHQEEQAWKSKEIAEGLFMSSRAVSGTMRKLVTDGFVEKVGQDPIVYTLTNNGKEIVID